jgi:hypothetical protein
MGAAGAGFLRVKLARLELENRALRAGLEAQARHFEAKAEELGGLGPAVVVLTEAAESIRLWIRTYDAARKAWDAGG